MSQGVDISEFQSSTPGSFEFYLIRLLNEAGRQDYRVAQHNAAAGTWARPRGAYGIIRPGVIDPNVWADRFIGGLHSFPWELVPTIDIELGDAGANRAYAAVLVDRLHAAGWPVIMGYYSAGSAYRWQCQDLFQKQWLAAWGSGFPAGADVHQWQGSPLDLDYCPDLGRITTGAAVPNQGDDGVSMYTPEQLAQFADAGASRSVRSILQFDANVQEALAQIANSGVERALQSDAGKAAVKAAVAEVLREAGVIA